MASNVHGFSGSPVMVEKLVVGHLSRILGDDEYAGRAAYGLLYATPSEAVLKLLGIQPAKPFVDPVETGSLQIQSIDQDEYHVVVSCVPQNRKLGAQSVSAFNIAGFRAIPDQRDRSPPRDLSALLKKSKTAVALIGKRWLASNARRELAEVLVGPRDFRAIPMILETCELLPEWQGIPAADWRGLLDPQGPSADRLIYAFAGQQAPPRSSLRILTKHPSASVSTTGGGSFGGPLLASPPASSQWGWPSASGTGSIGCHRCCKRFPSRRTFPSRSRLGARGLSRRPVAAC